jgi:hypothetical protein
MLAAVLILPSTAWAAPLPVFGDATVQINLDMARAHETQGRWGEALALYEQILTADRNHADAKKGYLFCLRQCHRKVRLGDPSFIPVVLNVRTSEVVDFYKDVLRKVHELYVDAEKRQLTQLFKEGVRELLFDLDDPDFRSRFLKAQHSASELQEFRSLLLTRLENAKVANLADAEAQVRSIYRAANRLLDLNPKIVVAEFACGACNALDEYSLYHTQGSLMMPRSGKTGIEFDMPEKGIGYVRIWNFDDNTLQALETVMAELTMSKVETLILDLRDNAGGSLDAAVQVVERFVPAPELIATTSGKVNKTFQSFGMNVVDLPIFVLVNGNTASAAELVAARLKSRKNTELVGQTTFGKNLIQKLIPVSQAPFGAVRMSWAQFQVPKTDDLAKRGGIAPTIPVDGEEAQMSAALNQARARLPMR